jgi:hypothetical protein
MIACDALERKATGEMRITIFLKYLISKKISELLVTTERLLV